MRDCVGHTFSSERARKALSRSDYSYEPRARGSRPRSVSHHKRIAGLPRFDLESEPLGRAGLRRLLFHEKLSVSIETSDADAAFFNDDVNTYNTRIGQIPEVFVASFMNLKPRAMFQVSDEDRKLVEVKFQGQSAGA